jgi:DNA-binding NarL/FixJ family response regulator
MDKVRTFIVEDSSVVRENLIAALEENAPIEVIGVAEDESTAVDWLMGSDHECDLVIVDIFLRAGTGLGVLKGTNGLPPGTRRVVLSNHATADIRIKCRELGADEVFDKSNQLDEMLLYCQRLGSNLAASADAGAPGGRTAGLSNGHPATGNRR